eukprot:sb/3478770/
METIFEMEIEMETSYHLMWEIKFLTTSLEKIVKENQSNISPHLGFVNFPTVITPAPGEIKTLNFSSEIELDMMSPTTKFQVSISSGGGVMTVGNFTKPK